LAPPTCAEVVIVPPLVSVTGTSTGGSSIPSAQRRVRAIQLLVAPPGPRASNSATMLSIVMS
jgi:hypothetical protein